MTPQATLCITTSPVHTVEYYAAIADDVLMKEHLTLLLGVLDSHHGEVVALFGITYELTDGGSHVANQISGRLPLFGKRLDGRFVDTLQAEQLVIGVLGLGQPVGKEEDSRSREDMSLLQRELPVGHDTDGKVGIDRQQAYTDTDEQGCIVTCITVTQAAGWQVEHTDKEGDEHIGFVHLDDGVVQGFDDAVGHRLTG